MMTSRLSLAVCVCAAVSCAHNEPKERTTISAVGNRDMTETASEPDNRKMTYTRIGNQDPLNPEHKLTDNSGLESDRADAPQGGRTESQPSKGMSGATASSQTGCDLNVYFATSSAQLDERAKQQLSSIAECLKRHEANDALIVGSADPRGSEPDNQKLGEERARVVSQYLRQLGVPQGEIRIRSQGESQASNQPATWPADRNAQIRKQQ